MTVEGERRLANFFCGGCANQLAKALYKEKLECEMRSDSSNCLWCPRCMHVYSGRCDLHVTGERAKQPADMLYDEVKEKLNSWL